MSRSRHAEPLMAYSEPPVRKSVREMVTSLYSIGRAPSALSMVSETCARPRGGRPDVPAKMTSSILPPRRVLAPCSPMTQARASTTLDLPEPLGPTTAVTPGSKSNVVADANDLKPRTVRLLRCKVFQISIGGGSGCLSSTKSSGKRAGIPGFPAFRALRPRWQLSPAAVARPRLADRASVRGTVHELLTLHDADDPGSRTAPAFLPLPAVGVEGPLEVTGRAIDVDVQGIETGAAGGQGIVHHVAGGGEERVRRRPAGGCRWAAHSAALPATGPRLRRCCRSRKQAPGPAARVSARSSASGGGGRRCQRKNADPGGHARCARLPRR